MQSESFTLKAHFNQCLQVKTLATHTLNCSELQGASSYAIDKFKGCYTNSWARKEFKMSQIFQSEQYFSLFFVEWKYQELRMLQLAKRW